MRARLAGGLVACWLFARAVAAVPAGNGAVDGYAVETYKRVAGVELHLHVFSPPAAPGESAPRPAIVFFFGGGWTHGDAAQFHPFAAYLASRGMVAISAEYRTALLVKGTTPFDCVSDARSALRWVRAHATRLRIAPRRIAAAGGSAGGQLAAACGFAQMLDASTDDLTIDPRPDALVLYNPVIDTGPGGYAYQRIGSRYREFSPLHNINDRTPPTIIFLGTDDAVTPVATARRYAACVRDQQVRCELQLFAGQKHGFYVFKEVGNPYYQRVVYETDRFLASLGYLTGEPAIVAPPKTQALASP